MAEQDKPLFIPLKAEYFADFWSGIKTTEYRLYGPRWNERVCRPGRAVTLSMGYGKRCRLSGTVASFIIEPLVCLQPEVSRALRALYSGIADHARVACIEIKVLSAGE